MYWPCSSTAWMRELTSLRMARYCDLRSMNSTAKSFATSWSAGSVLQRPRAGLQDQRCQYQARKRYEPDVENRLHRGAALGRGADHEGPHGSHYAADVVTESSARGPQPRRKQLRQIEREGAKDAEYRHANRKEHVQACMSRHVETEGGQDRRRRGRKIQRKHASTAQIFGQRNGQQSADQSAQVERHRRGELPALDQDLDALPVQTTQHRLGVSQLRGNDRDEGTAAPPGDEGNDGNTDDQQRPAQQLRAENLPQPGLAARPRLLPAFRFVDVQPHEKSHRGWQQAR